MSHANGMDVDQPVASGSNQPMDVDPTSTPRQTAPFPQIAPSTDVLTRTHTHTPVRTASPYTFSKSTPTTTATSLVPGAARIARTGYIWDQMMMLHCQDGYKVTEDDVADNGVGHPEDPMRIKRIYSRLAEQGLIRRMKRLEFEEITMEQVMQVHTQELWDKVQGTEFITYDYIQRSKEYYDSLSLYVCRETAHCARLSCGGVVQACVSVCENQVRNAFAIVRPPGHHAEPDEHMGFCFFNNVAVAAKEVTRRGLAKKVMILDWDIHHGNGTQRAFWNDPNVLYVSLHRHDGGSFYPTSDFGALDQSGQGEGLGKCVNVPWPGPGFGDADYIYAFQKIIMPIGYEFDPDLVIISAGFDAADGDQLGQCHVTPAAYGHMTHMLTALAGGKVVVALEGGYNLEAISNSALAVARVLLGETPAELGPMQASEVATEVVFQVAQQQSKYWKSINVKACEPPEVSALEDGSSPVYSISDLLKIHRAHHMFSKHGLFQIPLASEELEELFGGQVICNEGVYEKGSTGVLVVFVHDFGNLRVETDGVLTTNVHMTNSYLLDTSDSIVSWVSDMGYNLIDVNMLQQLPTRAPTVGPKMVQKVAPDIEGRMIRYIWDNYIELSACDKIILIGHGTGCRAIMDLINKRDVECKVKAVVQVAGLHTLVQPDKINPQRVKWFKQCNRIYVPNSHVILGDEKVQRRFGNDVFHTSEKAKVVDVLNDVLPEVKSFIDDKIVAARLQEAANASDDDEDERVNGHGAGSLGQPMSMATMATAAA
ncbi:hypothetical protein IAT38_001193 [Cryptococcus sp. DSM 104549]